MASASQSPFLAKAKSATLPSVSSLPVVRSRRRRSEPPDGGGVPGAGGPSGAGGGARCRARCVAASPEKAKFRTSSNTAASPLARFTSATVTAGGATGRDATTKTNQRESAENSNGRDVPAQGNLYCLSPRVCL